MIQINDYRIGNFIWVDRALRSICLINADEGFEGAPYVGFSGCEEHPYESCASPRVEAAPLSEAVLRAVGFAASPRVRLHAVPLTGNYLLELDSARPEPGCTQPALRRTVRHLHEVQNLYHALHGAELPLHVRVFA
ncbi:hypothetical protein [Flaviaesturariibacter amylovorans]|uniref:Uncharacterized protein n=1 Tax=Flaviaesturariibacter amylovorans TaxID=1084520 RepID=A0ABP8H893_9BACT